MWTGNCCAFPFPVTKPIRSATIIAGKETLPHSLTGGMSYNYFPRGRVELRHGKALVYLHPTLCTPGIYARIRHAFSLPDEMQLSLKADGSRHYRSIQKEQEG